MVHNLSNLTIYWGLSSKKEKTQKKKKIWTKLWKKIYNKTTTSWAVAWFFQLSTLPNTTQFLTFNYVLLQYYFSLLDIYYLLLNFNYFFLFTLNHTRLLSPRFLHFILLNFITSSSTLLHLRFAFLIVHNFCVFYQYQCRSASSQVLSLKFLNTIFFKLYRHLCSFLFFSFFFPFEVFWFTECKFVLVLRIIFFFFFLSTNFMPMVFIKTFRNTWNRLEWPEIFSEVE